MRGRNTKWDSWHESSLDRRDFRDNHGGGPEEIPHKKVGRKKGRGTKRSDHKHIWETNGPETVNLWSGNTYKITHYECLECGKRGNVKFDWS